LEKPTILVVAPISEEYVAKLSADPRIAKAQQLPPELWRLFEDMCNQGVEATTQSPGPLAPYFAEADIIVCWDLPHGSVSWAPRLKWVQAWSAGTDGIRSSGVFEAGIPVTNMAGVHAIPIAEHVLMMMLILARDSKAFEEGARGRQWLASDSVSELYERTVGVIGLGSIGSRVAKVCRGLDMRVIATRRTATAHQSNVQGVDELLNPSELPSLLERSDFVVLSCPLTPETRGLIGERELRTMKPTAFLINIARGEIVDEPVLKRALKEGWIAGAGLDVFWNEPLEQESELWEMPNVVMTPHMANTSPREEARAAAVFEDNLSRFIAGDPLRNLVDPELGY
jgi:phosphoglycerate dehydrogenase-like enzyme